MVTIPSRLAAPTIAVFVAGGGSIYRGSDFERLGAISLCKLHRKIGRLGRLQGSF
ncbi:hypothetical protein MPNT_340010 [Candidatus Methylacidithermus pantelleriae]|uniref:Uncharacterized protein n=1 Tax=Candidatus Methylacidithermus pantelleriae TaxID=2744239 RepID=A0A8J2BJH4_9BACT|nr:hypothetical protein MPNT_340010 [Candidatus Methylacidithermus pantelleriae]